MRFGSPIILTSVAVLLASPAAHAQREVVAMMASLSVAPDVCKWTDARSSMKIDEQIDEQIKALKLTAADWNEIRNKAKADLVADPSLCAPDGMLRATYDEASK